MSYCAAVLGACCYPSCTCGITAKVNMTPEQSKFHEQLAAQYGERILGQARELSGLTACMVALGREDLTAEERKRMYEQASLHLGRLLETMLSPALSAKVTECARRLDEAIALWAADEVERRDGLPPA